MSDCVRLDPQARHTQEAVPCYTASMSTNPRGRPWRRPPHAQTDSVPAGVATHSARVRNGRGCAPPFIPRLSSRTPTPAGCGTGACLAPQSLGCGAAETEEQIYRPVRVARVGTRRARADPRTCKSTTSPRAHPTRSDRRTSTASSPRPASRRWRNADSLSRTKNRHMPCAPGPHARGRAHGEADTRIALRASWRQAGMGEVATRMRALVSRPDLLEASRRSVVARSCAAPLCCSREGIPDYSQRPGTSYLDCSVVPHLHTYLTLE